MMLWINATTSLKTCQSIADIEDKVNNVMAKCEEIYDNLPGHWH